MTPIDRLNRANELAATPGEHGTREEWIRHYAAQAMAAFAGFYDVTHEPRTGNDRPEIGYLALIGQTSVAAVLGLDASPRDLPSLLWHYDPDGDALNGERIEEYIVSVLDRAGINPADLNERYETSHFRSPSRAAEVAR
ncbi:hypothetical protein ACWT_5686 [Actinoplanes sp. SE50]|uniref:hypothetical protein n=1 Tax=unclassified Actinoplanes TaxID=2626549 RepID=UPI00023ED2D5|nr:MULTISPECIES: hypothetical protein [unclassified Actinoplanes]AEV86703.1 hypothetical protein ACPL_5816 [Actinoplanes sp. SE50/110]ATO85101.1 hypothetical protein ACWT_5686 [Actinoplanes sp. SE50]SLM02512.1 hypothetical protein ACSP50_5762 [Actinoplanes sp. SE50/110]